MIFSRRQKSSEPERDPYLPNLTPEQADRLRTLVRGYLSVAAPRATVGGDAVHYPQGPRPLHNLAEVLRRSDDSEWARLTVQHFTVLDAATEAATPEAEALLGSTFLRLLPEDAFPPEAADSFRYTRPVATGLLEALALDLPDAVRMLDDRAVAEVGLEALRAAGRANLVAEPVDHEFTQGPTGAAIHIVTGRSMFVASKALVLDDLCLQVTGRVLPSTGALFTVPARHFLVFHPITDHHAAEAVNDLAAFGLGAHQDNPGPLSPRLYWGRKDGTIVNLTEIDEATRSFGIVPPGELMAVLRRLHEAGA